jgi:predicted enzyme related to lactoylglutathione lyase
MESSMAGSRRNGIVGVIAIVLAVAGCSENKTVKQPEVQGVQVYYLEIVTEDVDAVCDAYSKAIGAQFDEPDVGLGGARTAAMPGGSLIGVRAPMHESEQPVVRPYWLVSNIEAALAAAVEAGGEVAHPPLEIPGHGTFAIYIQGGIQHGLWQL